MAHFWIRSNDADSDWATAPLEGEAFVLGEGNNTTIEPFVESRDGPGTGLLFRRRNGRENWVLICPQDSPIRVNGIPVATGIRVLEDRDELRLGRTRMFFSTERLAAAERMPSGDREICCGRCRQPIAEGKPAVRCPRCGLWHHENPSEELPCWTYNETCAGCDQPTGLTTGFQFTPEGL